MPKKLCLEVGEIVGTHGVRGELRLQPWADSPAQLASLKTLYFDGGARAVKVRCRAHKNLLLVLMDGINTVQEAAVLRGTVLYAHREDFKLPKGRYFVQDLIGLEIVDNDNGTSYGKLCEVSFTGANDVYHIKGEDGKIRLIPAIPDVVIDTDIDAGIMKIHVLEGLFDED